MRPPLTILTVGDGDLSASLALVRAYQPLGIILQLVATTLLPDRNALVATYPSSAAAILEDLESTANVTMLYGVDATKLHTHPELLNVKPAFDLILFHHPHLGYPSSPEVPSSAEHALRHAALLAHYFYSASLLLRTSATTEPTGTTSTNYESYIHVCLCSGAVRPWQLHGTIQHLNLECVFESPLAASRPLLETVLSSKKEDVVENNSNNEKNKEKSKGGGSRKGHWLGKYGYRHKPTFPHVTEFKTNVSSSYHYFLRPKTATAGDTDDSAKNEDNPPSIVKANTSGDNTTLVHQHQCHICRQVFSNVLSLQEHDQSSAMPVQTS